MSFVNNSLLLRQYYLLLANKLFILLQLLVERKSFFCSDCQKKSFHKNVLSEFIF